MGLVRLGEVIIATAPFWQLLRHPPDVPDQGKARATNVESLRINATAPKCPRAADATIQNGI
jgi:hypothetical protein